MRLTMLTILSFVSLCQFAKTNGTQRELENESYTFCTILESPIVTRKPDERHGYGGLAFELLEKLEDRVGLKTNSTVHLFQGRDGFNGFVEDMWRCTQNEIPSDPAVCACDMVVAGFKHTRRRSGKVRFLPEFTISKTVVMTNVKNAETKEASNFIFNAFSIEVWALIFLTFFGFAVINSFDTRASQRVKADVGSQTEISHSHKSYSFAQFEPALDEEQGREHGASEGETGILLKLRDGAVRAAFEMLGQSGNEAALAGDSFRQRLISYVTFLAGLFLVLAYEASMTASLVSEDFRADYRTANDFKECRISGRDVCLIGADASNSIWNNTIKAVDCSAPRTDLDFKSIIRETGEDRCKFSVVSDLTVAATRVGRYCRDIVVVGEPVAEGGVSFLMSKNKSARLDRLENVITAEIVDLVERNDLNNIDDWVRENRGCSPKLVNSLTIKKLWPFFALAGSVIVALGLYIFVQWIMNRNR